MKTLKQLLEQLDESPPNSMPMNINSKRVSNLSVTIIPLLMQFNEIAGDPELEKYYPKQAKGIKKAREYIIKAAKALGMTKIHI